MSQLNHGLTTIPDDLLCRVYDAYQTLEEECLSVMDAIVTDESHYPVLMPAHALDDTDVMAMRTRAAKSITQLHYDDKSDIGANAGLLCASQSTLDVVVRFNECKTAFKNAVMDIRNYQKTNRIPAQRIAAIIRHEIELNGFRHPELQHDLELVGFKPLDLRRCYAQIRIIPYQVESFSWTWAATHCRIERVTIEQAIEMAKELDKEEAEIIIDILNRCRAGEVLAKKSKLPNQLRANYTYLDEHGQLQRKSTPISGVVVLNQLPLPRTVWRDNPGDSVSARLPRSSSLEEIPFIRRLELYRYV